MPGTFAALYNGFPDLKGKDSTDQKLAGLNDYLYQLVERLGYALTNLDEGNFNVKGLQEITDPIHAEIEDVEAGLTTKIDVVAGKIVLEVTSDLAPVWAVSTTYKVNDVVKIVTMPDVEITDVKYYKCTAAHTSTNNNKPGTSGGGAYWTEVPASGVANSRITQTADAIASEVTRATTEEGNLSSRITQTSEAISSEVTRATAAEGTLSSRITQTADNINARVDGIFASPWVLREDGATSNKKYYAGDVVQRTVSNEIKYYRCTTAHTAYTSNRPGDGTGTWTDYWTLVTEPTVQSVLDIGLGGITLSYDPAQSGANAPYITLNKDGVEIGGGPVYIGELDASTITTGALDAGNVTLREAFTVRSERGGEYYDCGKIGGYARSSGKNEISLTTMDEKRGVVADSQGAYLYADGQTNAVYGWVAAEEDNIQIRVNQDVNNYAELVITPTGIVAKRRVNGGTVETVDLFNL